MNNTLQGSIFIAGHRGLVGGAILRACASRPGLRPITRTRQELDLTDTAAVQAFFQQERPDYVVLAAAKVGGIHANRAYPVDFLLENLRIQNNVIPAAHASGVKKLLFLGSSCIYPKFAPQPISEDSLLTGPLEPTNDAYALAKIAGIRLCQAYRQQYGASFICAMPTNLYGPGDNFHPQHSHVLPALIRKFHEAKVRGDAAVTLWGTGTPRREFLHCDDLAEACLLLLEIYDSPELINVGCGEDITIADLANLVKAATGFDGAIHWDTSMPDGTPRKLLDVRRIYALGWRPKISLAEGIASTYRWFLDHPQT
jgi:GDP-L-fucose synthase